MSYNLLSGSVHFEGATRGTIEDIVDTHTNQTVNGQKTFSNISASSGLKVTGDVNVVGNLSSSINISASAFYSNGVLVNPTGGGISFDGSTANGVLTFKDSDEATVESKLKFDGNVLDFTDTSISGSGNISGSAFYGTWAGTNILGSQVQKASAGGIGDASGLKLTTTGLSSQATPAGTVSLFIDEAGTIKKTTITQLLTNQAITTNNLGSGNGRVLLDGGNGTITSDANFNFYSGVTPKVLAVTGAFSASADVSVGGILRADSHISASVITLASAMKNQGDEDTGLSFDTNKIDLTAGGSTMFTVNGNITPKETIVNSGHFKVNTTALDFIVSSSTGFLGIGTPSPTAPLEISSSNNPQFRINFGGTKQASFRVAADGNLTITPSGSATFNSSLSINGNTVLGDNSADTLTIAGTAVTCNNGLNFDSNTLFISSSNNRIGIGTVTPAAPLEIFSTNAQLQLSYNASDNATIGVDDDGHLTVTPSGGKTKIKGDLLVRDENEEKTIVQIYDNSDDGVISGYAANSITTTIHANGTSFFNGGNVAIGQTTTAETLGISGSFAVSGSSVRARLKNSIFEISSSTTIQSGGQALFEVKSPTNPNLFGISEGGVIASNIQPAAFNANLYISGAAVLGAPAAVVADANLHNGSVSFYLDEGNNKLKFRVRYSNGTLKNGEINLT